MSSIGDEANPQWLQIAAMPTCIPRVPPGSNGCHESCLRSFHVAREVRRLLELGTPPAVVLQIMAVMEGGPGGDWTP